MTPEHAWELVAILVAAILTWWSQRSRDRDQDERKARDAQAQRLGERIGALERFKDFERGRQAGLRGGRKQRGSNER